MEKLLPNKYCFKKFKGTIPFNICIVYFISLLIYLLSNFYSIQTMFRDKKMMENVYKNSVKIGRLRIG